MIQGNQLLCAAAVSVVTLVLLIARLKLHPFVALVIVSVATGIATGMPLAKIVTSFETGAGGALGHIAVVIALGTMLGKMLAESGGAEQIADRVIQVAGARNVHWAMACIALLVGIPVFFDVGLVLLAPVAFDVARRTGASMVLVGIPMVAALSVVHGIIPPHPAALVAVSAYHADIGRTMLYALIVGLPTVALAGPVFARLVERHVRPRAAGGALGTELTEVAPLQGETRPGFGLTVATILLPVALMLLGNWADLVAPVGSLPNGLLRLAGTPVVALLLALLVSFGTLGRRFDRTTVLRYTNECLGPVAAVILVVGAGAGFGRVLTDGGVSAAVVALATHARVPVEANETPVRRLRPAHLGRHAHQDGLDIAAGFQAEQRAAVVQEVEFHVAAAADELVVAVRLGPGAAHAAAHDGRVGVQEGKAHVPGEGKVLGGAFAVQVVVEDAAEAARFVAVREVEVAVAPRLEFRVVAGVVPVAGGLEAGVEGGGVLLRGGGFGAHGRDVTAAAEPAMGGDDHARVHVRGRDVRALRVGDQADAGGPESRVLGRAGHAGAHLGAELAGDDGDVHADFFEHAAVHQPDGAAAFEAGPLPWRPFETAGRAIAAQHAALILDGFERGTQPVAQAGEPLRGVLAQ